MVEKTVPPELPPCARPRSGPRTLVSTDRINHIEEVKTPVPSTYCIRANFVSKLDFNELGTASRYVAQK